MISIPTLLLLFVLLPKILAISGGIVLPLEHRPEKFLKRTQGAETEALIGGITTNGAFFATISLGSPPQIFRVQVDTGSTDFLIYGSTCNSPACTNGNVNRYDIIASSTSQVIPCTDRNYFCYGCVHFNGISNACFIQNYYGGGGNPNSSLVYDQFAFGNLPRFTISFGYITSLSGSFENPPASGIWGLAYASLGVGKPVMDRLVQQLNVANIFSMCLIPGGNAVMSIGINYSGSHFRWANVVTQNYYTVNMVDLRVNGISMGIPSSTYTTPFCAIDSGSTYIILPPAAYNALYASLRAMCNNITLTGLCDTGDPERDLFHGRCYWMTPSQKNSFPNIDFVISDMQGPLHLTPQQYFYDNQGYSCLGIAAGNANGPTILGDMFMQNYHVVFDRVHNRIGFGDLTTCPTAGQITMPAT